MQEGGRRQGGSFQGDHARRISEEEEGRREAGGKGKASREITRGSEEEEEPTKP